MHQSTATTNSLFCCYDTPTSLKQRDLKNKQQENRKYMKFIHEPCDKNSEDHLILLPTAQLKKLRLHLESNRIHDHIYSSFLFPTTASLQKKICDLHLFRKTRKYLFVLIPRGKFGNFSHEIIIRVVRTALEDRHFKCQWWSIVSFRTGRGSLYIRSYLL